MRSLLATLPRVVLAAVLSGQIIVGGRPWIAGGDFTAGPPAAYADESTDAPKPVPNGAAPTDATKRDAAVGFGYQVDTNSGAFTTQIPIETPPGRMGVEPRLALTYSSASGMPGLAGVGWDLAIPMVRAEVLDPLNQVPRYVLDGKRLIEDAAAPGTFATEQDGYARIRRTCTGTTCAFVVDEPSGLRMSLGTTDNARTVGRWGLDRVEDAHGNYMTITYFTDAELSAKFGSLSPRWGALLPKEIRYTGSASVAPWYKVTFDYELRPQSDRYIHQNGWTNRVRYRLTSIRVVGADGLPIRGYTLSYTPAVNSRSLLAGVAVTGVNGATGPAPFTMSYTTVADGLSPAQAETAPAADSRVVPGDFNADGRMDLMTYRRSQDGLDTHRWWVQLGGATGLGLPEPWLQFHPYNFPGACGGAADDVHAGDWDGDGDTDLFHYVHGCGNGTRWQVLRSTGWSFTVEDWIPPAFTPDGSIYDLTGDGVVFGDVTDDGRADAVVWRADLGGPLVVASLPSWPYYDAMTVTPPVSGALRTGGDFNGDGKLDVLLQTATNLTALCAQGGAGFAACGTMPSAGELVTGDFNGDGLTDVFVAGTPSRTYTSTVEGFLSLDAPTVPTGGRLYAGDVDGDGRDDLMRAITTASFSYALRTWIRRGEDFMYGADVGYPDLAMGTVPVCSYFTDVIATDVTGDGRVDPRLRVRSLLGSSCDAFQFATTAVDAPAVDKLASIQTPTGMTVQPTYARSVTAGLPVALVVVDELRIRDFPRWVINRVLSPVIETHRYQFSGGKYDAARRELMGFSLARDEIVERNLTESVSYFQDLGRRGKPAYRATARTTPYQVLASDDYRYRTDTTAPYRTELEWHHRRYWSEAGITANALQGFGYDARGNVTRMDDHGLCGRTDDDRRTTATYRTAAATGFNVSKPGESYVYAGAAAPPSDLAALTGCTGSTIRVVEATRDLYDNTTSSIVKGDLTRRDRLLIGPTGDLSWVRVGDFTYRADGLLASATDARGFATQIVAYDPVLDMYPARLRSPAGFEELREYVPQFGKLSKRTDANAAVQSYYYDAFGRPIAIRTPLSAGLALDAATWTYGDGFPNWTAAVKPYQPAGGGTRGGATVTFHDALGRSIAEVRDGDTATERVIAGRTAYWAATEQPAAIAAPAEVAVASCGATLTCLATWALYTPASIDWAALTTAPGALTQLGYDALGRAIRRDNPDGSFVTYDHTVDVTGFGLLQTDEVGDQRRIYRDARGDIARVERWSAPLVDAAVTTYTHDARRKLTGITSPLGTTTTLTYGSLGRLDRVDSPELGTLTFGYDADGHETSRTDARGVTTTTVVDAIGRPTYRTSSTGEQALWAYDRTPICAFWCSAPPPIADRTMGRPWAVIDATGMTTFAYDGDGHLARETRTIDAVAYTTSFVNHVGGAVVRTTYPDGEVHHVGLGPDGGPVALTIGAATAPAVQLSRDALDRPATVRYASGATMQHTVDPVTQRITAIETRDPGGAVIQRVGYEFRPDGTVESATRGDALGADDELYLAHDGFKRVTDVFVAPEVAAAAEHYEYDADGRMTVRQDRGGAATAVGHADPQHPNAVTAVGARTLTHDAAGNRITDTAGAPMSYDAAGRLTAVGAGVHYTYDADGRRVIEQTAAGTRLVLGGYSVEPDGTTRKALQLGALRVGERSSVGGNRFLHPDGIGSVIGETTAAGALDTARTFSAYGVTVDETVAAGASRYGFAGYPRDAATGLDFAQARYYDPTTASFTQPDSWLGRFADPEALNGYAYAANSPYQYNDPSGQFPIALAIVAVVVFSVTMYSEYKRNQGITAYGVFKSAVMAALAVGGAYGASLMAAPFFATGGTMWAAGAGPILYGWTMAAFVSALPSLIAVNVFRIVEDDEITMINRSSGWKGLALIAAGAFLTAALPLSSPALVMLPMGLTIGIGAHVHGETMYARGTHDYLRVSQPTANPVPPPSCGRPTVAGDGQTLPAPCAAR